MKDAIKRAVLRFLGLDVVLIEHEQIKEMVTEHDKALAVSAIVQIKIMNELIKERAVAEKKVTKRKVGDDFLN